MVINANFWGIVYTGKPKGIVLYTRGNPIPNIPIILARDMVHNLFIYSHLHREVNTKALIIFISNYIEYTPKGYTVNAFRYVLKPTIEELFEKDFKEAIKRVSQSKDMAIFKVNRDLIAIPKEDIIYFESANSKIIVHIDGAENSEIQFYGKLDDLEKKMGTARFLRIQKSILVNIKYIKRISSYKVYLTTGDEFTSSRKNYKELTECYVKMKLNYITDAIK